MSDENSEIDFDVEDDMEEEKKYKGSALFANWYRKVFLPNGGRIHSSDPHMLWDELKGEFFDWLDEIEMNRQEDERKRSKRTFEYWYEHEYKGARPTEGDPKDDDQIWGEYEAWDELTHFMDDMSEDERQGWEDLYEHITLNGD